MAAKPPILPLVVLVVWLPTACGPADEPDPAAANASSDGASLDGATTDPDSSGATDTGASADSGPAVDAADTATPLPQCATADDCPAQNPCMIGSCTTKGTCAYAAKADASPCDDGNACTTADACAAGQCLGKGQLACDDENPCTADKCNPYAGCLFLPAAASSACDDGDACTQGDSCQAGQCEPGVNTCQCKTTSDCNKFEDGDQCNGTLYCDKAAGAPYTCKVNPASVVSCPSVNNSACQKNTCVPATGQCKLILSPENTPCDDGDTCTTGDFCDTGLCQGGANTCYCKKDSDCKSSEDGNLCNGSLFCNKATAQCQVNPITVVTCQTVDDTQCLRNTCNPKEGKCYLLPLQDGKVCEDGNPCTPNEACDQGQCQSAVNTCECQKDADCQAKDDGNLCNGTLYCDVQAKKCRTNPATLVSCNTDDDPACLADTCDPKTGKCKEIGLPKDGTACDDGNPCTALSLCSAGSCVGQANVCECQKDGDCAAKEDGNLCNGTLFCNPKSSKCEVNPATVVACASGFDENCLTNQCDPKTGGCGMQPAHQGNQCDDGSVCSAGGWCALGTCEVTLKQACECVQDSDCAKLEDGDLCNGTLYCDKTGGGNAGGKPSCKLNPATVIVCQTVDNTACSKAMCQAKTGKCAQVAVSGLCEDGKACTDKDTCANGSCLGLAKDCSDGIACTTDSCQEPFGCVSLPGSASSCDDQNPCTQDSCDAKVGCKTSSVPGGCDDGDPCTKQDGCKNGACSGLGISCDDGNACTFDLCTAGTCSHQTGAGACSDGDPCTAGDSCAAGQCGAGKPLVCQDNNPCTVDACNALMGKCTNVADAAAACSDGNVCTTDQCDPKLGCGHGLQSGACNDADSCTVGESCSGGACGSGKLVGCDDVNPCTLDGCDPKTGCSHAPINTGCDDQNVCTAGDHCVEGKCRGSLSCDDGNSCTADACDFAQQGCVHLAVSATCSDGNTCTQGDACTGGKCQPGKLELCDDANPCTGDDCHPQSGCFHFAKGGTCTLGKSCTVLDTCLAGKCVAGQPRLFSEQLVASAALPAGMAALEDGSVLVGSLTSKLTVRRLSAAGAVLNTETQADLPTFAKVSRMKRLPDGRVLQAAAFGGSIYLMRFGSDGKRDLVSSQVMLANSSAESLRAVSWRNLGGTLQYLTCAGAQVSYLRSQIGVFDESGKYLSKFEYASAAGHNECAGVEPLDNTGKVVMVSSTTADGIGARIQVLDSTFKVLSNVVIDSGDAYPSVEAMVLRPNGAVVLAGSRDKSASFATAWWTAQVNAGASTVAWQYKQDNANPVSAMDISLIADGSVVAVGWFYAGRPDMKRLDPAGKLLSTYGIKDKGSFVAVSPAPDGDLWVAQEGSGVHNVWRMSPYGQVACAVPCDKLRLGDCDDGEVCTFAQCTSSICTQSVSAMACDDGSACAINETCVSGSCKATATKNCSDSNPCTADTCDPATGCEHQALADGVVCGTGKACASGLCL